jgi:hypothetical protein
MVVDVVVVDMINDFLSLSPLSTRVYCRHSVTEPFSQFSQFLNTSINPLSQWWSNLGGINGGRILVVES